MGFFSKGYQLKRQAKRLLLLFTAIYLLVAFIVGGGVSLFLRLFYPTPQAPWKEIGLITGATFLFITSMTLLYYLQLKGGVQRLFTTLRAEEVRGFSQNPLLRRYYQVAIEMAIAANIPLPRLYLIPVDEINALAAASSKEDVAIGITEGALIKLTRQELQALIAHEMSHILHGDCLLNFRVLAYLAGLQSLYLYGRDFFKQLTGLYIYPLDRLCLGVHNQYRLHNPQFSSFSIFLIIPIFTAFLIMLIGCLGAITARVVRAFISQNREYLADMESVRLTRSKAIIPVLEKIVGLTPDEASRAYQASSLYHEYAHFYLDNYNEHDKAKLFDTHPPIIKRILAVDPNYNVKWFKERLAKIDGRGVLLFAPDTSEEEQALVHYLNSESLNRGAQKSLLFSYLGGERLIEEGCARIYATFLVLADNSALLRKQKIYLKEVLMHRHYQQVLRAFRGLRGVNQRFHIEGYINAVTEIKEIHPEDLQALKSNIKELIVMNHHLSIEEYLFWRYLLKGRDLPNDGEMTIQYQEERRLTHQTFAKSIQAILNVLVNHLFSERVHRERYFQEGLSRFNLTAQYQSELPWFKILEEQLPLLAAYSLEEYRVLATLVDDYYNSDIITEQGRGIIHLFTLIVNLPVPKALQKEVALSLRRSMHYYQ